MERKSLILLVVMLILFGLYIPLDAPRGTLYHFKTWIDDLIILDTRFTIIYLSYFVFLGWTLYYFFKYKGEEIFNRTLVAIIISVGVSYFVYIFFQNYIIRPEIVPGNIFDHIYIWINERVPPFNAFPSLHVAISVICLSAFIKIKSRFRHWVLVWVFLICLSTVYAKQHYFLDVVSGLGLGIVSFIAAPYLLGKRQGLG